MIVHLDKERQKQERRKLIGSDNNSGDIVFIIFHDALRKFQREGVTELSSIELFLSANKFSKPILKLTDPMEGLEDEMDDLEREAQDKNDAMLIMMLAAHIFLAIGKHRIGFKSEPVIQKIYERWNDHPLFLPFLEEGCKKEQARWLEGKRTNLLTYELEQIEADGEGEDAVRQVFEYFIDISEHVDKESIKGSLIILNKYNLDHGNAYAKEMNALYEKLGIKSSTVQNIVYPQANSTTNVGCDQKDSEFKTYLPAAGGAPVALEHREEQKRIGGEKHE